MTKRKLMVEDLDELIFIYNINGRPQELRRGDYYKTVSIEIENCVKELLENQEHIREVQHEHVAETYNCNSESEFWQLEAKYHRKMEKFADLQLWGEWVLNTYIEPVLL